MPKAGALSAKQRNACRSGGAYVLGGHRPFRPAGDPVQAPSSLVFVVLDESCLRRSVGEPAVMNGQLDRLLKFAELPNTVLQIAPFEMGECEGCRHPPVRTLFVEV